MSDIRLASLEELITELGSRCSAWVVAIDTDLDADGHDAKQTCVRHGGKVTTALGLVHVAAEVLALSVLQSRQE